MTIFVVNIKHLREKVIKVVAFGIGVYFLFQFAYISKRHFGLVLINKVVAQHWSL